MTNQGDQQASIRAFTGTSYPLEGDWHALFDLAGIAVGPFDQRLLLFINARLGTSYTNLPGAMQAYAVSQGYGNWGSMGSFSPGGGAFTHGFLLENGVDLILLEDGASFLQLEV